MNELIFSLLLWIGDHSFYDIYLQQPDIAQITSHKLCKHYGIDHKQRCEDEWRIQNGLTPVLSDFNAMMLATSCDD